jgi:choline dehydrogenase-like flavoprotein
MRYSVDDSMLDGMVYTRGSAEDFDRYAAVTGDPGWSWDNLLPYFFRAREIP